MTRERALDTPEAALLGDALRARAIGESSPFLLCELDQKRRVLYLSPNYQEVTGFTPGPLIDTEWTSFLHPGDTDRGLDAFEQAARGRCVHLVVRVHRAAGAWRWFDCFLIPFRTGSDELRVLALSRDVTEAREHWERFRLIRDSSLDLVAEMDPRGIIRFASGSHEKVLGYAPEELVGAPLVDFVHGDDVERVREAFQDRGPDERLRGRFRVRDRSGSWRWIECTATTYQAENELRVLGVSREVSEGVALEQALRESQERALRLALRQEDEREAERARVAREIHDELGQGLTGLRLNLLAAPDAAGAATPAMLDQIDQLLDSVRRIGARMLPPSLEQFGLVAGIESQARSLADAAGWRLRTELAAAEPGLDGEQQSAVFRVAQEALTNVARHAGASEVVVTLEISNDGLRLRVRDDGRGIPPECVQSPRSSGIGGMRARAAMLSASLRIEGTRHEGTVVELLVPRAGSGDGSGTP